ncbi:hypothetical protein TSAR_005199 [Trichomalopsis sarcophagae]|uniref:Uncharacterized protein n=1 Tax=Trichomalopsis sarcophagae TaxID=543379 RepID=A0A232EEZ0_9HYME|nr:hypothetical protein TSAR_005199 [Trichomalopsis sarcophagae]
MRGSAEIKEERLGLTQNKSLPGGEGGLKQSKNTFWCVRRSNHVFLENVCMDVFVYVYRNVSGTTQSISIKFDMHNKITYFFPFGLRDLPLCSADKMKKTTYFFIKKLKTGKNEFFLCLDYGSKKALLQLRFWEKVDVLCVLAKFIAQLSNPYGS